jgi:GNAT superfamily N-acetyltransferase
MSSVEIEPIELPRDTMRFCKTWWRVFRDDPMWVPPLLFERKSFFNPKKNPYFKVAEVQCFIATRDGEAVGTIAATVDEKLQEHQPDTGLFGFYTFIDDEEVARALLEAAKAWLAAKGMKEMIGPFDFNANHEFGLLVDGFDTPPCVGNPHNSAYFGPMYDKLGLEQTMDWYAYWMDGRQPCPKIIKRVSDRFLKRHPEVTLRPVDLSRWEEECMISWNLYNDAWEHNWGHVEFTFEEYMYKAGGLKQIIKPDLCWVAEVDGEPAGFSITLPDYNIPAKKMNGRLFPLGWWHFWRGSKDIDVLRILILGVKQEFQHMALGAPLYVKTWEAGLARNVRGAEASLILHENNRMRGALEKLGGRIYKTYRSYRMPLV